MSLPSALKAFLESLFIKIDYQPSGKEIRIPPQGYRALQKEQLDSLIKAGFIDEELYERSAWCNQCDVDCDIIVKNQRKILICWECQTQEEINEFNSLKYSTGLPSIIKFLQKTLGTEENFEAVREERLFYLGSKERTKYYFLRGIRHPDCQEIIQSLHAYYQGFIFCLSHHHTLKTSPSVGVLNVLDVLSFKEGLFSFNLPQIVYQTSIASLGGKIKAEKKYGQARHFVWAKYQELHKAEPTLQKQQLVWKLADALRENPDLIQNLTADNLEEWVRKTINIVKDK